MALERGIDANPSKIKALVNTRPPTRIKNMQQLLCKITALSRFISPYGDKCIPMFKVLVKQGDELGIIEEKREKDGKTAKRAKLVWNPECQKGFEDIKEHVTECLH